MTESETKKNETINTAHPSLQSFQENINSQYGEDGIIAEILKRLDAESETDHWCVEFGAWNGIYLSNTCNLIKNNGYKAVLIEASAEKHKELCKNFPQDDIYKICAFVDFSGESTLDNILAKTPIPNDFDFLSIDIDGCDYFILESLKTFKPKVICIEFNPIIPNEVEFVQPKDFKIKQSSSPRSIVALAKSKGYLLAAATFCNLFFIKEDLYEIVTGNSIPSSLESLRDDTETKTYLFIGFDGTVLSNRDSIYIPWHQITLKPRDLQQIPAYLRTYPADYSYRQRIGFVFFTLFKFPDVFKDRIIGKLKRTLKRNKR